MFAFIISDLANLEGFLRQPWFWLITAFQIWMLVDAIRREEWVWAVLIFLFSGLTAFFYYLMVYRSSPSAAHGFELPGAHERKRIKELEAQIKAALAGKVPADKTADASTIWVESIISNQTKEGLVNIRWGNLSAQLSVKEAHDHAYGILQAAEAAQTDAVLFDYFTNTLGSTPEMFAKFIQDFRAMRERKTNV